MNTFTDEIVELVFSRWGLLSRPVVSKEEAGKIIAISLGLGTLFNEDADAEQQWMHTPNQKLKTQPITAVLAGRSDEVLALVNKERGL